MERTALMNRQIVDDFTVSWHPSVVNGAYQDNLDAGFRRDTHWRSSRQEYLGEFFSHIRYSTASSSAGGIRRVNSHFDFDGEVNVLLDGQPAHVGQRPDHVGSAGR